MVILKLYLEDDSQIFAYIRSFKDEKLLVINNFYGKETIFNLPEGLSLNGQSTILISNYKDTLNNIGKLTLRPYESIVFHIK